MSRCALIAASLALMNPAHAQVSPATPPAPRMIATPSSASPYDPGDDVFYHIMPIAWRYGVDAEHPADPRSEQEKYRFGNFQGIVDGLPYLKSLGVTAIWLNPIFPSPAYHGYQHGRADRINPWFGDEAGFVRLVSEAKKQGVKVFLDLVVYGISQDSDYFKDAFHNRASLYASYLAFKDEANDTYVGYDFKTWNGDTVGFVNWDLRSPQARALVIGWSKKWLDPNGDGDPSDGIAGYRLDHVWHRYEKGEDGLGYHIDSFWKEWRAELEKVNPRVFSFAEQADWRSCGAELLVTSDGERAHDATFTKPFEEAARQALREEKARGLYESMAVTIAARPQGRTFLGILGDHDVDRLASSIGADKPETLGRAKAAAAVLMLQPFPPIMYSGDEIGMLGKEGSFESDANDIPRREPMKWRAQREEGGPATRYFELHEGAFEKRYSRDHDGRSVQEQSGVKGSLLETYRELSALRASQPALRRGEYIPIDVADPAVWCFAKRFSGETLIVAINLAGKPAEVRIPLDALSSKGTPTLVPLAANAANGTHAGSAPVSIPAYGYSVMRVNTGE